MATTRATLAGILASIAVLVVGWQAGGAVLAQQPTTASGAPSDGATNSAGTAAGTATSAPSTVETFTGDSVNTRYGAVQVRVTVSGSSITDVMAVHLTDHDRRSVSISNRAAPMLRDTVLSAQSASVSNVSGATYTSDAYLSSLQSALDQAGL